MSSLNPSPNIQNFSEKQLKFAAWYVARKMLLKKILIGFLIVLSAVFWIYGIYGLINYYFIEEPSFNLMTRNLSRFVDYQNVREKFQPQNLEIGAVSILSAGKEKYDLAVKISNPNANQRLNFDYNFVVDGKQTISKKGFILPGEEKFLLGLGAESKTKPRQTDLEFSNMKWQRIDAHQISDYKAWQDERLNFIFENVKFSPAVVAGNKIAISRASFKARNATVYGFWDVGFAILLYRGSSLVGANYITLEEFLSGQTRQVEVSWFEPLPSVTRVEVAPEVDIFDARVFMPVE